MSGKQSFCLALLNLLEHSPSVLNMVLFFHPSLINLTNNYKSVPLEGQISGGSGGGGVQKGQMPLHDPGAVSLHS